MGGRNFGRPQTRRPCLGCMGCQGLGLQEQADCFIKLAQPLLCAGLRRQGVGGQRRRNVCRQGVQQRQCPLWITSFGHRNGMRQTRRVGP